MSAVQPTCYSAGEGEWQVVDPVCRQGGHELGRRFDPSLCARGCAEEKKEGDNAESAGHAAIIA